MKQTRAGRRLPLLENLHPLDCPECRAGWVVEVRHRGALIRVWKQRGQNGCPHCCSRLEALVERPELLGRGL